MAALVQLDEAANLVGKSEVTLRRLIKAGKVPFHKEKTLTGFIYLIDPEQVRAYYDGRPLEAVTATEEPEVESQSEGSRRSSVRVAVAGESGNFSEYWQKKAEIYEERYTQEMSRHAHTREELGLWRGRAEQAQSMLVKLLPAPVQEKAPASVAAPAKKVGDESVSATTVIMMVVLLLAIFGVAAFLYWKLLP